MRCSLESGKMAVMARLLSADKTTPVFSDGVANQKCAAEYIWKELREADEANLLDEEDMHVFGLRPMTDPLELVRCNACKKPVKASQFAAHAELCRTLTISSESVREVGGRTTKRKLPRRQKKLIKSDDNHATGNGVKGKFPSLGTLHTSSLECCTDKKDQVTSSYDKAKGPPACGDAAIMMNCLDIKPENADLPTVPVMPPTKYPKLKEAEHLAQSDSLETTSRARRPPGFDNDLKCVPAPLATKIYYSQRSNRLQTEIKQMYFQTAGQEFSNDVATPIFLNQSDVSSPRDASIEQIDESHKKQMRALSSTQNRCEILANSLGAGLSKPGRRLSNNIVAHQLPVNDVLRPVTAPVILARSNYRSMPCSFANDTGNQELS